MTFVLGMLCKNGIVMCSDSLESDGYSRSEVQKLNGFSHEDGRWGISWGCAGDAPVIKRFDDKLREFINKEKSQYDRHRLEEIIETLVKKMRDDYPDERLSLVASLWGKVKDKSPETRLYSIKEGSNCLGVESYFACTGMDLSLGRFLLDSIFYPEITTIEGTRLGIFVTHVMKEKADGVGGATQILFYDSRVQTEWIQSNTRGVTEFERARYQISGIEKVIKRFWCSSSDVPE